MPLNYCGHCNNGYSNGDTTSKDSLQTRPHPFHSLAVPPFSVHPPPDPIEVPACHESPVFIAPLLGFHFFCPPLLHLGRFGLPEPERSYKLTQSEVIGPLEALLVSFARLTSCFEGGVCSAVRRSRVSIPIAIMPVLADGHPSQVQILNKIGVQKRTSIIPSALLPPP